MITSYVISLKEPTNLLNLLPKYNLNPIWIKGVNGHHLTDNEISYNTTKFYSYLGPKSVIGISLAHIKAWKYFLKNSTDDYCIIFEDDIVLEHNFTENLQNIIENIPTNFDILYLGCFGCDDNYKFLQNLFSSFVELQDSVKINKYINSPKMALGLHGYILSRKGADKLIYYIDKKINSHIDVKIMKLYLENKIIAYSLNNSIVYQTSTDMLTNSMNVSSKYPLLLSKTIENINVEKMFKLNYALNVSLLRIWNMHINPLTIIFLITGLICCKISPVKLSILFLLISLPDIYVGKYCDIILFSYIIFILPSIVINVKNKLLLK